MSKFVFIEPARHALSLAICEATGIEANSVRRIVIDFEVNSAAKVYVEAFADDAILDVNIDELGIKVVGEEEVAA